MKRQSFSKTRITFIYLFDTYLIGDLMSERLVRLEPGQDLILEKLLSIGIYKTRSEIIRAGILELAKEYKVFQSAQELEDELVVRKLQKLDKEEKQGKRKVFTAAEVKKKYGFK